MRTTINGIGRGAIRGALAVALTALIVGLGQNAWAQSPTITNVFQTSDWSTVSGDSTIKIANEAYTGLPTPQSGTAENGKVCAMIYVFDANQEMQECCGCPVTNDGLRTLSLVTNLTANPVSAPNGSNPFRTGVIAVVPEAPSVDSNNKCYTENGQQVCTGGPTADCDPALIDSDGDGTVPDNQTTPALRVWTTHVATDPNISTPQISEVAFATPALSVGQTTSGNFQRNDSELATLQALCGGIHVSGSGFGICSCGTGDNSVNPPRANPGQEKKAGGMVTAQR